MHVICDDNDSSSCVDFIDNHTDLPFQSILSCSAVCRSMLHETLPLLTKLCIDKSSELHLTVAARFRDIREIQINSLLIASVVDEWKRTVSVDLETKVRLLPFLLRFEKLEIAHFGGKDETGNDIERFTPACDYFSDGDEGYPNEGPRERMLSLIDLLSGAFRCGALPKHLMISGLCCPDSTNRRSSDCEVCLRACDSFPLESVLRFECHGLSYGNACSGRSYGLDTCLERDQLGSIIESRGGHDLLRSEERLLRLMDEQLLSAEVLSQNSISKGCNAAVLWDEDASLYPAHVTYVGEKIISVKFYDENGMKLQTTVHRLPLDRIVKVYDEGMSHSQIVKDLTPSDFDEDAEYFIDKIICARAVKYGKKGVETIVYRVKYHGDWEKLADQYWFLEGSKELDLALRNNWLLAKKIR